MAINQIFAGTVGIDNWELKIAFQQPEAWQKTLESLNGKRVKVVIKEFKAGDNIRSITANSYYWGIVVEILRHEFGYEKLEMHDALGLMFRQDWSKVPPTIIKTSTMSSRDFWDYINRVQIWASTEYGLYIPDPNKVEWGGK